MHITSAETLIRAAADVGVEVYIDNGRIRIRGAGTPPDDLIRQLRRHKADLLDHLKTRAEHKASPPEPGQAGTWGLSDQFEALAAHVDAVVASTTDDEAADAKVRYWRRQLDVMPRPADARLARVVERCKRMVFETFIRDAARLGWTERDLFGWAGPHAKAGHGLVVGLALMPSKDRPTVVRITADYAEVVTAAANRIRMPIRTEHPPIWT